MTKVICIVGLPGSGKTWQAIGLAQELPRSMTIDDIMNVDQLPEPDWYDYVIVTDPRFCLRATRVSATKGFA